MISNASCHGPCRKPSCRCRPYAVAVAACLLLAILGVAHGVYSLRRDADREIAGLSARIDRLVARAAALDASQSDDVHAAFRRVIATEEALDAEKAARTNEVAAEAASRVADAGRIRHDLKSEAAHRERGDAVLAADLGAAFDWIARLQERLTRCEAGRCRCKPVPVPTPDPTPKTPPLPSKVTPEPVAPRAIWYVTPGAHAPTAAASAR